MAVMIKKPSPKLNTEAPAASKNPCDCGTCHINRIFHWFCDHCGAGPFRFQPNDPGTMKAAKPAFVRVHSHLDPVTAKWVYTPRYSCSKPCVEKEKDVVTTEMIEMAGHRPDLQSAISTAVQARQDEKQAQAIIPELNKPDGGAYTPGIDDL
jgi:hypothetical protein